jgi:membrane protein
MNRAHTEAYKRVKGFLSHGVWSADVEELPRRRAALYQAARYVQHAATGFTDDQCLLRASALTYTSLLSLVPLLAIMFAVLKGLGVQKRLEPLLLEQFTVGSQEVVASILEYVDRTNVSSLGIAGVIGLLITAIMTLRNMEGAFNWIWKVHRGRSWARTVSDYLSILMIAPFCFLLAMSATAYFSSPAIVEKMASIWLVGGYYRFLIKLGPFVFIWIAFTACYMLMPNTRVRFTSALWGGVVGGTLWQLAQWGYVHYQIGMGKYNAIYGALSQLPILLVWIYVSWVILLLGAELAYAHQNLAHYSAKRARALRTPPSPAVLMLRILQAVGERFQAGERPYTLKELEETLHMDRAVLKSGITKLEGMGWLAPCEENGGLVVFQRPPAQMPLHLVVGIAAVGDGMEGADTLMGILERTHAGIQTSLGGMTVADLLRRGGSVQAEQDPKEQGHQAQR